MVDSPSLTLRILYTINSSPQYILARSHAKVPVCIVEQNYATTSLKACLTTICRSSPELIQDSTRDFSVYVLDPLESLAPLAFISSSPAEERSGGVAVGLGLMSWALAADESNHDPIEVTGTLTKVGAAQQLEIVFLLREISAVQKSSVAAALRPTPCPASMSTFAPANPASSQSSAHTSAPANNFARSNAVNRSSSSVRSAHAIPPPLSPISYAVESPYVYLRTPPKKGRPPGGGSRKNKGKEKELGKAVDDKENARVRTAGPHPITSTSNNQTRYPSAAHQNSTVLSSSSQQRRQPEASVAPFQHLIAAMSGGVSSEANRALLSAIETIDLKNEPSIDSANKNGKGNAALTQALKDLLTVATLTKPAGSDTAQTTKQRSDDEIVLLDKANIDPAVFRRRADEKEKIHHKSSSQLHSKTTSKENSCVATAGTDNCKVRKRTLSQFMEDRERDKELSRVQKRINHEDAPRHVFPNPSSPPPSQRPLWPRAPPLASASSPPRPPRYIVPDWAKTKTALQPRFAQRDKEVEPFLPPVEKKHIRDRRNGKKKGVRDTKRMSSGLDEKRPEANSAMASNEKRPRATIPTARSLPVIASQARIASLSSPSCHVPKTPPRRADSFSLFTPVGKEALTSSPAGSRTSAISLFTPVRRAPPPSPTLVVLNRRSSKESKSGSEHGEERPDENEKTLEGGSEESGGPPTSLPIASSDVDSPETSLYDDKGETTHSLNSASRPHWSIGLPPSSPPPPSSPALTPQNDAEEEEKRLAATPESKPHDDLAEVGVLEEQLLDFSSSDASQLSDATGYFDDLGALFADPPLMLGSGLQDDYVDPFGLFDVSGLPITNGVSDFDLTEFWESVKPLMQSDTSGKPDGEGLFSGGNGTDEIDHLKLAEDLQTLFGGCLV